VEPRSWHKSYEAGVPPALDFEPLTVPQFLGRAAARHGDTVAVVYFNRRLTYKQLKDHVDRFEPRWPDSVSRVTPVWPSSFPTSADGNRLLRDAVVGRAGRHDESTVHAARAGASVVGRRVPRRGRHRFPVRRSDSGRSGAASNRALHHHVHPGLHALSAEVLRATQARPRRPAASGAGSARARGCTTS